MTNAEFEKLKNDLEDAMDRLEHLQQIYIGQTGQRFVKPLRLAPRRQSSEQSVIPDRNKPCHYEHGMLRDRGQRYCENCLEHFHR